jgi:hypothetical protein
MGTTDTIIGGAVGIMTLKAVGGLMNSSMKSSKGMKVKYEKN